MKKIVTTLLVLGLFFSIFTPSETFAKSNFSDVPENYWGSSAIQSLTEKGIIGGYPDGTFKPNASITRTHAVLMLMREKGMDTSSVSDPGFADMHPGVGGYVYVAKAVELGIIDGMFNENGEKIFNPHGKLTRSQMAKIISVAYNLTGTSSTEFSDIPKSHWSYPYVQGLAKHNVSVGYTNGKFGGADNLTRVQFAVMMARILDGASTQEPKEEPVSTPEPTELEPEPVEPEPTEEPQEPAGEVYPDGWIAPVLKSEWSTNHTTNLATLQNELGFKDGGRIYGIPSYPQGAIHVSGHSSSSENEVTIKFYFWTDPALQYSERIPVVAKELFKLYFAGDATRVWDYFNSNDIPESFTANGRTVTAYYSPADGAIALSVGRK